MIRYATWGIYCFASGWFMHGYLVHVGAPADLLVAGCATIVCFNGAMSTVVLR